MANIRVNQHGNLYADFRVARGDRFRITFEGPLRDTAADHKFAEKKYLAPLKLILKCGEDKYPELVELFPNEPKLRDLVEGGAVSIKDLFDDMQRDYETKGLKSWDSTLTKVTGVLEYFAKVGVVYASECTTRQVANLKAHLINEGCSVAYVNRHLAALKRAFNLGVENGRIDQPQVPGFPEMSDGNNARTDYFTPEELDRLIACLPVYLRNLCKVAFITGWRRSELLTRQKGDIKLIEGTRFLTLEDSKNGDPRLFPLTPELEAIFEDQAAFVRNLEVKVWHRVTEFLFPNPEGQMIGAFRKTWMSAIKAAGLDKDAHGQPYKRVFHGFRRSAVGNLDSNPLVSQQQGMKLVGHKTDVMWRRYAKPVTDARMLAKVAGNLVPMTGNFGQLLGNLGAEEKNSAEGCVKNAVNSRGSGWAGSESNTRHKDFQSR
jgi:integrase